MRAWLHPSAVATPLDLTYLTYRVAWYSPYRTLTADTEQLNTYSYRE